MLRTAKDAIQSLKPNAGTAVFIGATALILLYAGIAIYFWQQGLFDIESPPMDLAFDVYLRVAGREWHVGQIDSEREHPWDFSGEFRGFVDGLNSDSVDIVLRPSTSAARETLRIDQIWGGVLEFKDVSVTREQ